MDICERIALLAESINALPRKDYNDVSEFLEHNEWGVAFEIICSALDQDRINITEQVFREIENIGAEMKLEPELWEVLKPLVIPDKIAICEKLVWKFEGLEDMKEFAKYISFEMNKRGENELAAEVGGFEYNCYTTSSEYLGEFRITLLKILAKVGAFLDEETRGNISLAIETINKAWNR